MDEHEEHRQDDELPAGEAVEPELGAERTDVADLTSELGPPVDIGTFPLMDAILLAGHLRSMGIPATSDNDSPDGPFRMAPGMGGFGRVFVRPEDAERARDEAQRIADGTAEEVDQAAPEGTGEGP
ncbi:MAG TPA: hypothetical protein VID47_17305 [Actinomycetota bacterium]|jgi:hypothetical protein